MKKLRRIISIVLCITMLLSLYLGCGVISADAATVTIYHCYDTNGHEIKCVQAMNTHWKGENQDRFVIEGHNAYCIQPGVMLNMSAQYTQGKSSVYDGLSSVVQDALNVALCYGWGGNSAAIAKGTTINEDQGYIATQLIVWELVNGVRNPAAPYNLKSGQSGYLGMYCAGGANPNIKTAYNRIVKAMGTYQKIPSFTNIRKESAPTITLTAVYNETSKKWEYSSRTLNDSNKVLSQFKGLAGTYNVGNAMVSVSIKENKLTLKCSNGNLSGKGTTYTISTDKTGIPRSSSDRLFRYGNPSHQDLISGGGHLDPPNAVLKVNVDTRTTTNLTRDARIQKSCWTHTEADDTTTSEGEGSLSTAENLKGWYFYVEVPAEFKNSYGVDHIILGPTDENGFTQKISEYIKAKLDKDISHNVPTGMYDCYELGKLKSGASGNNLSSDYYFPDGWSPERGSYANHTMSGQIRLATDASGASNPMENIGYCNNVYSIPLRIKKAAQDNASVQGYYFRLTSKKDWKATIVGPTDNNGVIDVTNLDDGEYIVEELGKKSGSSYAIPSQYDTPTSIDVEISAEEFKNAQEAGNDAIEISFLNTVSSYIAIEKSDRATGNKLSGAKYGIYSDSACDIKDLMETLTTDASGYARSKEKYPVGTYYLKETQSPPDYDKSDTVHKVEVTGTSGGLVKISVTDDKTPKGTVTLRKISEKGSALAGSEWELYGSNGQKYFVTQVSTGVYSFSQSGGVTKLSTNSSGVLKISNIPFGNYYLKETKAPTGYRAGSTKSFTVSRTNTNISIDAVNHSLPGSVTLRKTDSEDGKPLGGTKWALYTKAGVRVTTFVKTGSYTYLYTKSGTEQEFVTSPYTGSNKDEAGMFVLTELPFGGYYLVETQAKPGYILSTAHLNFTISTTNLSINLSATNTPQHGSVTLNKVSHDDNSPLSGSHWELHRKSDDSIVKLAQTHSPGYPYGDYIYRSDGTVTDLETTSAGVLKVSKLPLGEYYFKETKAPSGYNLKDTTNSFTLTASNPDKTMTIKNTRTKSGMIKLYKVDVGGRHALAGSQWALYKSTGERISLYNTGIGGYTYTNNGGVNVFDTDSQGLLTVQSLPTGNYYFKEVKAPLGYVLSTDKHTFYAGTYGVEVTAENDEVKGDVTLYKTDLEGKYLEGSVWELYREDGSIVEVDMLDTDKYRACAPGERGATSIVASGNHVRVMELPIGSYYFKEIGAPYGYELSDTVTRFTISMLSFNNQLGNSATVTVRDNPIVGSVTLHKTDGFGTGIGGSKWMVYKADGSLLYFVQTGTATFGNYPAGRVADLEKDGIISTDSDGLLYFYNLLPGKYYMIEAATPDGKMPYGKKINFTISLDGYYSTGSRKNLDLNMTVKDNNIVTYNTGGSGTGFIYSLGVGLLFAAIFVSAVYIIYYRKKGKNQIK